MIVNSGKQYILDKVFNHYDWNPSASGNLYMGIGLSSDTNVGVVGPTTTTPVPISGNWSGPSNADWRLTEEVTGNERSLCEVIRAGRTVFIKADIDDNNIAWDVSGYYNGQNVLDIVEVGVFIYPNYDKPSRDPTDLNANDSDRSGAMIARFVFYDTDGSGNYVVKPIQISKGQTRRIKLAIADLEG